MFQTRFIAEIDARRLLDGLLTILSWLDSGNQSTNNNRLPTSGFDSVLANVRLSLGVPVRICYGQSIVPCYAGPEFIVHSEARSEARDNRYSSSSGVGSHRFYWKA